MKLAGMIGVVSVFAWLSGMPAAAHDCWHHNYDDHGCWDCGHHGYGYLPPARNWQAPAGEVPNLQTVEGKIEEVVYLPGATADTGMVEIRMQTAGQVKVVRLAPVGFLKKGGLHLREGDTVVAKGFSVTTMDGDLLVATEVRQGGTTLSLRDAQGRPAW